MISIRKRAGKPVILSRVQMNALISAYNSAYPYVYSDNSTIPEVTYKVLAEKKLMKRHKTARYAWALTDRGYKLTQEYLVRRSTSPIRIR
jgi:hypothetical protein